jgi:flagellar biogenesis protein FliO
MPTQVTFIILFVAVLALIGVGAWAVRRFTSNRVGSNPNRGRMPRLAVIDAATVDSRRRLMLVRRDNVEHLLMIGGPSDIVIESNIVRGTPQRDQAQTRPVGTELPQRVAPLPDAAHWTDGVADAPAADFQDQILSELPPRSGRSSFADEVRRQAPATGRAVDPLAGLAHEPRADVRAEPPVRPRPTPRSDSPMPRSASMHDVAASRAPSVRPSDRSGAAPAISPADQNLAEMAQRLEAALRRPGGDGGPDRAPPVAPEPPNRAAAAQGDAAPAINPGPRGGAFENLEDEMASLLGRPKSPT